MMIKNDCKYLQKIDTDIGVLPHCKFKEAINLNGCFGCNMYKKWECDPIVRYV